MAFPVTRSTASSQIVAISYQKEQTDREASVFRLLYQFARRAFGLTCLPWSVFAHVLMSCFSSLLADYQLVSESVNVCLQSEYFNIKKKYGKNVLKSVCGLLCL